MRLYVHFGDTRLKCRVFAVDVFILIHAWLLFEFVCTVGNSLFTLHLFVCHCYSLYTVHVMKTLFLTIVLPGVFVMVNVAAKQRGLFLQHALIYPFWQVCRAARGKITLPEYLTCYAFTLYVRSSHHLARLAHHSVIILLEGQFNVQSCPAITLSPGGIFWDRVISEARYRFCRQGFFFFF